MRIAAATFPEAKRVFTPCAAKSRRAAVSSPSRISIASANSDAVNDVFHRPVSAIATGDDLLCVALERLGVELGRKRGRRRLHHTRHRPRRGFDDHAAWVGNCRVLCRETRAAPDAESQHEQVGVRREQLCGLGNVAFEVLLG
eukprot:5433371-Prymnesium_polylepis.1